MEETLLTSLLQAPTPITGVLPLIGGLIIAYIAYQVFYKKESKFVELFTTPAGLPIIFVLLLLAIFPAAVTAITGLLGMLATIVVPIAQIATVVLLGAALVYIASYIVKVVAPGYFA